MPVEAWQVHWKASGMVQEMADRNQEEEHKGHECGG